MSNSKKKIVLAAGGTGGHIFPAEALASELKNKGCKVVLITDIRYKGYSRKKKSPVNVKYIKSASTGGNAIKKIIALFYLAIGTIQAAILLKKIKPEAVVGFGGYPSFPTMFAAQILDIKTILHEQNAVLGRVNRFFAKKAYKIATSFPKIVGLEKNEKIVFTGNPVRPLIKSIHDFEYSLPGDDEHLHILVTGGSQGARILSEVLPDAVALLSKGQRNKLRIDQQCRQEDLENVKKKYKKLSVSADLAAFFHDVHMRMASSHLVIARAGASTVAELAVAGCPSILVPYKYAMDNHQVHNAKSFEKEGGTIVVQQDDFNPQWLAETIKELIKNPEKLSKMAKKAKKFSKADAALSLADLVLGE